MTLPVSLTIKPSSHFTHALVISSQRQVQPVFVDLIDLRPLFLGDTEPSGVAVPALHDHVVLKKASNLECKIINLNWTWFSKS